MERNRWETAIRCLEIALHPNTTDDEVIAAVNGFRRTANGTPLSEVCFEFGARTDDDRSAVGDPAEWREKFDRLSREYLDLQRKLDIEETSQASTFRRLHEAERRVRDLHDDVLAARRRADAAERRLDELRSSFDDVKGENLGLRRALDRAGQGAPERPAPTPALPFEKFLAAARLREGQAATAIPRSPAAPSRENAGPPNFRPAPRAFWTA